MAAEKGNKYGQGNANAGQKPKFETADQLWDKAQAYIESVTDSKGKTKATISGLAFHLGFESRQSLYDYENNSEAFSYIIKRLRVFVESCYEAQLYSFSTSGAIFALKNMGWRDKTESDVNSTIKMEKVQVEIIPSPVPIATSEKGIKE